MLRLPSIMSRVLMLALVAVLGCGGDDDDGLSPGDAILLTSGTPVTGISGAENSQRLYRIVVPEGATILSVETTSGDGDLDLFVRRDAVPTGNAAEGCASEGPDSNESCVVAVSPGTYYILLIGFEAYSGVTLIAEYTGP